MSTKGTKSHLHQHSEQCHPLFTTRVRISSNIPFVLFCDSSFRTITILFTFDACYFRSRSRPVPTWAQHSHCTEDDNLKNLFYLKLWLCRFVCNSLRLEMWMRQKKEETTREPCSEKSSKHESGPPEPLTFLSRSYEVCTTSCYYKILFSTFLFGGKSGAVDDDGTCTTVKRCNL